MSSYLCNSESVWFINGLGNRGLVQTHSTESGCARTCIFYWRKENDESVEGQFMQLTPVNTLALRKLSNEVKKN